MLPSASPLEHGRYLHSSLELDFLIFVSFCLWGRFEFQLRRSGSLHCALVKVKVSRADAALHNSSHPLNKHCSCDPFVPDGQDDCSGRGGRNSTFSCRTSY